VNPTSTPVLLPRPGRPLLSSAGPVAAGVATTEPGESARPPGSTGPGTADRTADPATGPANDPANDPAAAGNAGRTGAAGSAGPVGAGRGGRPGPGGESIAGGSGELVTIAADTAIWWAI
jgi:hypothetical protein